MGLGRVVDVVILGGGGGGGGGGEGSWSVKSVVPFSVYYYSSLSLI